ETPQAEARAHVEMVRDRQRHERDAPTCRRRAEKAPRVDRQQRGVPAGGQLAYERQDLDLTAAPPALGADVQDVHRPRSAMPRMRSASANHIAMATSPSPNVYCVTPPTRKPIRAAHAPAAVAHASPSRAAWIALQPQRSALA